MKICEKYEVENVENHHDYHRLHSEIISLLTYHNIIIAHDEKICNFNFL
jgi:hypothetical protein